MSTVHVKRPVSKINVNKDIFVNRLSYIVRVIKSVYSVPATKEDIPARNAMLDVLAKNQADVLHMELENNINGSRHEKYPSSSSLPKYTGSSEMEFIIDTDDKSEYPEPFLVSGPAYNKTGSLKPSGDKKVKTVPLKEATDPLKEAYEALDMRKPAVDNKGNINRTIQCFLVETKKESERIIKHYKKYDKKFTLHEEKSTTVVDGKDIWGTGRFPEDIKVYENLVRQTERLLSTIKTRSKVKSFYNPIKSLSKVKDRVSFLLIDKEWRFGIKNHQREDRQDDFVSKIQSLMTLNKNNEDAKSTFDLEK